ncbi:MAG: PhzF family phenazine biosynthesis protein [Hyphomicrobiales bacterium]
MASYKFETLDVFTHTIFGGNQLAVLPDARGLDGGQMQQIAREFNLAETTFVLPAKDAPNTANVRIFTPAKEMPFAGHPTIGTSIVLAEAMEGEGPFVRELTFEMHAGLVPVTVARPETGPTQAVFTTPIAPVIRNDAVDDTTLGAACSLSGAQIGMPGHEANVATAGAPFAFLPVADAGALSKADVDTGAWRHAGLPDGITGITVYTRAVDVSEADWQVRMFAPEFGIGEDPATGSAAAALPGQLAACEDLADGTHDWLLHQGYEMRRPSQIGVSADIKDGTVTAVRVSGAAVRVSSGVFNI